MKPAPPVTRKVLLIFTAFAFNVALSPFYKVPHPKTDGCEIDKAMEGHGKLSVSGSEAASIFEAVETPLDAISQGIDMAVDSDLNFAVALRRDYRRCAARFEVVADGVDVVALLSD
jgi:hypothetical protein